ncbi:MAG: hypothetical protein H0Z35_13890 [Thermoanaerobacteraceae bacterium]|nr:hypothetical protein [Thermoanaerobacteraceae bacterium]
MKEKKLGQLTLIIQIILLFISDTLTKTNFGGINKLIPLTVGTDIARKAAVGLKIEYGEWGLLIMVSLLWLVIGSVVFNFGSRVARQEGGLGSY